MDNKIIILEALKAGVKGIEIIVEGMKAENKQRELLGESLAYTMNEFDKVTQELMEIIKSMYKLVNETGE